jgi:alanine racemase
MKGCIFQTNIDIHYQATSLIDMNLDFCNCKRIGEYIYRDSLMFFGKVIKILYLEKGSYIGYDFSYKLKHPGYVAVVDIGYSDGLERRCGGFKVLINGKYYNMIGLACMNHSFVLVDREVELYDNVEFIGKKNKIENYLNFFKKIPHQVYLEILKSVNK